MTEKEKLITLSGPTADQLFTYRNLGQRCLVAPSDETTGTYEIIYADATKGLSILDGRCDELAIQGDVAERERIGDLAHFLFEAIVRHGANAAPEGLAPTVHREPMIYHVVYASLSPQT